VCEGSCWCWYRPPHAGKMIDAPTVLQARNVLALAERLEQLA
jgi:citrate lyase beta subunit